MANANVTLGLAIVPREDMALLDAAKCHHDFVDRTIKDLEHEFPGCKAFKMDAIYLICNDEARTQMIVEAGGGYVDVLRGWQKQPSVYDDETDLD